MSTLKNTHEILMIFIRMSLGTMMNDSTSSLFLRDSKKRAGSLPGYFGSLTIKIPRCSFLSRQFGDMKNVPGKTVAPVPSPAASNPSPSAPPLVWPRGRNKAGKMSRF